MDEFFGKKSGGNLDLLTLIALVLGFYLFICEKIY
jgi:hypothetical protein